MRNEDLLRSLINFTGVIIIIYLCLWSAFEQSRKTQAKRVSLSNRATNPFFAAAKLDKMKAKNVPAVNKQQLAHKTADNRTEHGSVNTTLK